MSSAQHRWLFLLILLLGIAARIAALSPYGMHHPDEMLQYLEQAHRLAFGTGIVPWEYRLGMRSWLVPLLLAGPMVLGEALLPGTLAYVVFARIVIAVLAFAPVVAAYVIGRRSSRVHGLVAMAIFALWYESVYFSVHVLTEMLSVSAFLSAAALIDRDAPRGRLIAGGALLGLATIFRFHYAPAFAVYAVIQLGPRWRAWGWVAIGAAVAGLVSGAVDLAMGQAPFGWIVNNFYQNIVVDKASEFGRDGLDAYPQMLLFYWGIALVPILWAAVIAARRFPALAATAVVTLLVHAAIGHKEYRFILLAVQIIWLLAALGTVDLIDRWRADRPAPPARGPLLIAALGCWAVASTMLAFSDARRPGWRAYEPGFRLAREAHDARACGVLVVGTSYWATAGQTYLRGIPLFYSYAGELGDERRLLQSAAPAYNAVIAPRGRARQLANYKQRACGSDGLGTALCLAMRPGGCVANAASRALDLQRVLERGGR